MPPEFLTRYAGVFLDVHIFPPKRHSNFRSVGILSFWCVQKKQGQAQRYSYGALEPIEASGDDWNDKEDSINKLSINCTYFSGVILMIIKHDKIRSYCMVRQIQGPNIFEKWWVLGTKLMIWLQITKESNVSDCFHCLQTSQPYRALTECLLRPYLVGPQKGKTKKIRRNLQNGWILCSYWVLTKASIKPQKGRNQETHQNPANVEGLLNASELKLELSNHTKK
jgi:hypothetical protein